MFRFPCVVSPGSAAPRPAPAAEKRVHVQPRITRTPGTGTAVRSIFHNRQSGQRKPEPAGSARSAARKTLRRAPRLRRWHDAVPPRLISGRTFRLIWNTSISCAAITRNFRPESSTAWAASWNPEKPCWTAWPARPWKKRGISATGNLAATILAYAGLDLPTV